jgi:NADPH:quinone reductase-like Zn-dependent oxidoreductase
MLLSNCLRSVLQLIPGHEIVGIISQLGRAVVGFSVGDRCVADNTILVRLSHRTHTNGVFNDLYL